MLHPARKIQHAAHMYTHIYFMHFTLSPVSTASGSLFCDTPCCCSDWALCAYLYTACCAASDM